MKRRSFFAWLLAAVFGWNMRSKETLPLYINPYLTDNEAWYLPPEADRIYVGAHRYWNVRRSGQLGIFEDLWP